MTDHPHMPPIHRYTARLLCPGKLVLVIDGREMLARRDDALSLAEAICESLQLEKW